MATRIEILRTEQLRARRTAADRAASRAIQHLKARGVEASLIGSLKTGSFGLHSDVDFLVTKCPKDAIYAIEADIEDCMGGLPFDVVYLDLVPPAQRERWLSHAH